MQRAQLDEARRALNWAKRERVQALLESYGFGVYDSESDENLTEEVMRNVEDGTIPLDDVLELTGDTPYTDPRDR